MTVDSLAAVDSATTPPALLPIPTIGSPTSFGSPNVLFIASRLFSTSSPPIPLSLNRPPTAILPFAVSLIHSSVWEAIRAFSDPIQARLRILETLSVSPEVKVGSNGSIEVGEETNGCKRVC